MINSSLLIIICILIVYNCALYFQHPSTFVVSAFDGKSYRVKKNHNDVKEAADTLAKLNNINMKLIEHLEKKYKKGPQLHRIKFLKKNYNPNVLEEHTPRSTENTSYVLNKGDAIKLCLRDQTTKKIHDFNTLVFVNLHELSHLYDMNYGHTETFWQGFKFILQEAVLLDLYDPINYKKIPHVYCGLNITNNPYFSNLY